jgi:hypothetical protein
MPVKDIKNIRLDNKINNTTSPGAHLRNIYIKVHKYSSEIHKRSMERCIIMKYNE